MQAPGPRDIRRCRFGRGATRACKYASEHTGGPGDSGSPPWHRSSRRHSLGFAARRGVRQDCGASYYIGSSSEILGTMPDPLRDVLQALEAAPPPKVERVHDSMSKPFHDFAKEAEKLSPLSIMSEQTKEQAKNALKSNWRKIVRCFLEASIYCALYHHATEEVKKRTKKRRRLNKVLTYLFDIALPAPIYAPLFGFLLRLASPI